MPTYDGMKDKIRMFEFKERLQEKLIMEQYYKILSDYPTMSKTDALTYAAESVREKVITLKTKRETEENK
jgi:hypothetical protein